MRKQSQKHQVPAQLPGERGTGNTEPSPLQEPSESEGGGGSGDMELIWGSRWPRGRRPGEAGDSWNVPGAELSVTGGEGALGVGRGRVEPGVGVPQAGFWARRGAAHVPGGHSPHHQSDHWGSLEGR